MYEFLTQNNLHILMISMNLVKILTLDAYAQLFFNDTSTIYEKPRIRISIFLILRKIINRKYLK